MSYLFIGSLSCGFIYWHKLCHAAVKIESEVPQLYFIFFYLNLVAKVFLATVKLVKLNSRDSLT